MKFGQSVSLFCVSSLLFKGSFGQVAPVLNLDASTYNGSGNWISTAGDGTSCEMGPTSTFDSAEKGFEFSGAQSDNIKCPFEIGATRFPQISFEVEFYYRANAGIGWIVGHDNNGYDRSVIISDSRFGGMGQGIGRPYTSGLPEPPTGEWHHVVVVYDQGANNGSFLVRNGIKGATVTASNGPGESEFTIGGLRNFARHGLDGYIRKVAIYDEALTDNDIGELYAASCVSAGTCDDKGGAFGDPHIKTWNGEQFDFHGVCDLVLARNRGFGDGAGLDVQIRTKRMMQWSYISSAVVRIGKDSLEVRGGKMNKFWINGIEGNINTDKLAISGYPIKYQRINNKSEKFVVELGNGEAIIFKTWNSFVSIMIEKPNYKSFRNSVGLMGSFPEGLKFGRDNSIIEDINVFGQEWQVLSTEQNLFHDLEGPQHPTKCEIPSSFELRRRLQKSSLSFEEAEKACIGADFEVKELCIFDVIATNDRSAAGAY